MQRNVVKRPPVQVFTQWTGDNLAEFEERYPHQAFTAQEDGMLVVQGGVQGGHVPPGYWFDGVETVTEDDLAVLYQDVADGDRLGYVNTD